MRALSGLLAVVAALLAPAPAAPSGRLSPEATRIEGLFDEWRFDEARAALDAFARSGAPAEERLFLEGYASFLDGDYDGAVRSLRAAQDATVATAPAGADARGLLSFAEGAADAVKDHREERSAHFTIRYPANDEVLVGYALDTLEAAYAAVHDDLGFTASRPIRVDVYRSPIDLAAVSSLTAKDVETTGTIALCKWARLMVTSPRALTYGYPWLDTLNHEFVHYAVSALSRDRAPVWLQEGLAKFLERRWRGPADGALPPSMEHELAKALKDGKLIGFDAMHPSMAKLPSAEAATLAFAEVAVAMQYLHERGGMGALRTAVKKVADGVDAREAVGAASGAGWSEFEKGWRAFMASQHYRSYPGFDPLNAHLKIRKAAAIASKRRPSEDEALADEIKNDPSRKAVRLGNMLLRRDRPRAAAVEYEKAAQLAGGTGPRPAVAVKLGRTYLALGEPDRALKAVAQAQELYPDLPGPNLIAGQARLRLGDAPKAAESLRASLATNPFDPEVHCTLAEAYDRLPAADGPPPGKRQREHKLCQDLRE